MQNIAKIKPSRNGKIILSLTDKVNQPIIANMSFNAIHLNKILAKISEFTVTKTVLGNFVCQSDTNVKHYCLSFQIHMHRFR